MVIPPAILMILKLIGGLGGMGVAQKFGPKLMRMGLQAIRPSAATKVFEGTGRGMRALRGVGSFAGPMAGWVGGEAAMGAALPGIHDQMATQSLAPDPTADDVGPSQMPWLAEEQAGLQKVATEEQLRMAFEQLGIDYDEFMLAQAGAGGIV